MTERELKRLRRADLLELFLEERRENEQLRRELEEVRGQLADRNIRAERFGSLAEAALALSGVFESAQEACDLYLENIRRTNQAAEMSKDSIRCKLQDLCGPCPIFKTFFESEQPERENG